MENNKKIGSTRGAAALLAIVAVVLLIIGAGAYFLTQKTPAEKNNGIAKNAGGVESPGGAENVPDIGVSVPKLDFSSSPLSDLNVSSLNVAVKQVSTGNIFSAPSINTDFSYKPVLNISMPNPTIDFQMPAIPANIPAGGSIPSVTPSSAPAVAPSSAPSVTGQPQIDCSAFSTVPSCSYTGAPGSEGYEACKQCYPNK